MRRIQSAIRMLIFVLTLLGTLSIPVLYAATIDDGNTLLKNGQIDEAIQTYEAIIKEGYVGHELFFNLGTAYTKKGNISKSIFNFEKALRLKPLDAITQQQIVQLNLNQLDKPPIYEDTGLLAFLKKIQFSLSIDAWAFLAIGCMLLFPISIFISYKFQHIKGRKAIFLSSIGWLLLSGFSVLMARNHYHFKYLQNEGIVNTESIKVFDQADPNSGILFNLHEGAKVEIDAASNHMYYVQFAEKKGWVLDKDILKIEL